MGTLLALSFFIAFAASVHAKPTINVFVISDFSLSAVAPTSFDRSLLPSGPFICPPSAFPSALAQFQFTSDVIAGVSASIPMRIQYYVYSGGDGDALGKVYSTRDNFTETSIPAYTKFCSQGPDENDFERFIKLTITPAVTADLMIIFTAAPQWQVDRALPLVSNTVNRVIVLGLNGTMVSSAYPYSGITLSDFSEPARVSCMINELSDLKVDIDAVRFCYPQEVPTTERPKMRILFINDFTSDYIIPDNDSRKAQPRQTRNFTIPSKAIKCPGNYHPEATQEFDFTSQILQGLDDDIEIYYYANNGDGHKISPEAIEKKDFETSTEFKNIVCATDDPHPSDFDSLSDTIDSFNAIQSLDIIVFFSSVDSTSPLSIAADSMVIAVGLRSDLSAAYPDSSIRIDHFDESQVAIIDCIIQAAYRDVDSSDDRSPVEKCSKPRDHMSVLVVNDFTIDFLGDYAISSKRKELTVLPPPSRADFGRCPGGIFVLAGQELNFTVGVISSVRSDVQLGLGFYEYLGGGDANRVDSQLYQKEEFPEQANAILRRTCAFGEPEWSNLLGFAKRQLSLVHFDVILLFTAEHFRDPLPIENSRIIVVGLNGADHSAAYPNSSLTLDNLTDQRAARTVSCMLNRLWDNPNAPDLRSGCV